MFATPWHPVQFDSSYCNIPSVLHNPPDNCNRTWDFTTEDATEIGSWWNLLDQFQQYVIYPEELPVVYSMIPECQ